MNDSENIIIYTDGGCSGNPGPGGWAFVIIEPVSGKETAVSGGEPMTTNNRMELTAVISAFIRARENFPERGKKVSVFIDSQYVKDGITKWIANWKRNGWRTTSKDPVKNQDLWTQLDELVGRFQVEWIWVKGHSGVKYNEIVDRLTQDEIAKFK